MRLMWQLLRRDWRSGELTTLGLALLLAVASLTSVGFLTDRVSQALTLESHQLLGGDLLISADHALPAILQTEARRRGLHQATTLSFPSMVLSGAAEPASQLAEIKAVTPGYPLRGQLHIARELQTPTPAATATATTQVTDETPQRGHVWLDERLLAALDVKPGEMLQLGDSRLKVAAILMREPDRGIGMMGMAPRLLMHLDDVAATGLVRPASRVTYRLQLAGDADTVAAFAAWAQPRLGRGERLEDMSNARPEMRTLLERAQRFLRLTALLAVVLAAIAVAFAADRYMRRHLDGCAVMRCLGASQAQILLIHGGEFLLFGLLATLAGCLAGYATQAALQQFIGPLLSVTLPPPALLPWLHGVLIGMVLMVGFALPPLLRLRRVSTLRVLRREWGSEDGGARLGYLAGLLALASLMLWIAGELRLGLIVIGGFIGALGLYALLAAGLLRLICRWGQHPALGTHLPGLRLGIASLRRHQSAHVLQAAALGLGLTALLLITVTRNDLLNHWQTQLPADAPNHFIINIQPEQRQPLRDFFTRHGLAAPTLEPMIRGRLTAVNGHPIQPGRYADERAQHLADREFNLSWTAQLPVGNRIVSGRWHGKGTTAADGMTEFSVEQGLARTLELKLGDRLDYDVAGQLISGRITSLRQLNWDSMRVNFFVIAPPGALDALPVSDITSIHLPASATRLAPALVRDFPNLTLIDITAVVRQLQATLDQIIAAIHGVLSFALLAGLIVLWAALQASQDTRQAELALLRALGARSRQLHAALVCEFALLGSIAGLLAGLGATLIAWILAHFALQLDYTPNLWHPALGMTACALGITLTGSLAASRMLRRPLASSLRGGV
jgi:putative ABC transport system permease protein